MVRRKSGRKRRLDERGFTLIELMVVVVIVAILAAVAIPQFFSEAKKVKSNSEVSAMLAELSAKEERYKLENNGYLALATECPTPSVNGSPASACATGWAPLGVLATETNLRCGYRVEVGTTTDDPTTAFTVGGAAPTNSAPTTTPAQSWYVVQARCDIDGNGVFSHYVTSNLDSRIQKYKEGQ